MAIPSVLTNFILRYLGTAIVTFIFLIVVFKISKLYYRVYTLPPGPFPLPLVGNLLLFRVKDRWDTVLRQVNIKYGPVFTLWLGIHPVVIVSDIDLARDAFRKNDFSGRPKQLFGSLFSNEKHQDVVFTDFGDSWEALRKVTHMAAQNFAKNDKLVNLSSDTVNDVVNLMISREGINREFNPINYIYLTFFNIIAISGFGRKFNLDDCDFKKFKYALRDFNEEVGARFFLWECSVLFQLLDRKLVTKFKQSWQTVFDIIANSFNCHQKDYDPSIERNFCDALISARNEYVENGKDWSAYLTDANLAMAVCDIFVAGADTSQNTFQWMLLFIGYYPEVQKKLKQEIENRIGNRIPTHEDRNQCHYVMAFISEILRFRNVAQIGLSHKAVVTCKIGDHTIPEGNGVFVYQGMILTDEKYFPKADLFRPDRFLQDGKFMNTRSKAYIPFGVGRRICLGEKLAIANLFLVLVRFLQLTNDYDIVLGKNGGLDPDTNITANYTPNEFNIIFKTK